MFVIQSGFASVREVALAPNVVAIRNGEQPLTPEGRALVRTEGHAGPNGRITWDVELWSLPPDTQPRRYTHAAYNPFGFDFDPRTGWLLFGEPDFSPRPELGVKRADGRVVVSPDEGGGITGFALSPDGDRMLCLETWRDMSVFEMPIERRFVLCTRTSDGGWVRHQVVRRGDEFLEHPAFLPDGERFVATGQELRTNSRRTNEYHIPVQRVFDARTFALLESFETADNVRPPYFCGKCMATRCSNGILFHDTTNFTRWPQFVKSGRRKFVAFAPDPHGRFFLTASGHRVSMWETTTWSEVKTFAWKAGPITCLAVAPDGLTAAAGTATGKVVVWDVE